MEKCNTRENYIGESGNVDFLTQDGFENEDEAMTVEDLRQFLSAVEGSKKVYISTSLLGRAITKNSLQDIEKDRLCMIEVG